MNLSKAFDTVNHSFLLAKLKAYGFSAQILRFLQSYLCNRFQRSIIMLSLVAGMRCSQDLKVEF